MTTSDERRQQQVFKTYVELERQRVLGEMFAEALRRDIDTKHDNTTDERTNR